MTPDEDILRTALDGYKAQLASISGKIADIEAMLSPRSKTRKSKHTSKPVPVIPASAKHKMSAAGRASIAAAQRKRWAAHRKAQK